MKNNKNKVLVIHGPNLNLLGQRETDIYGKFSIDSLNKEITAQAAKHGLNSDIIQSNHEGEIVDIIGQSKDKGFKGIIINPAAYTHTSVAIRDAISATNLPVVEVHLSNIYAREDFRHTSLTAGACIGQITGFGGISYILALEGIVEYLRKEN